MTNKKNKKDNYSSFPRFGGSENIVDIDKEEELEEFNLSGKKKLIDNRRSDMGTNKKMKSTTKPLMLLCLKSQKK